LFISFEYATGKLGGKPQLVRQEKPMNASPGQISLNIVDAAYIAGVIDGEGTITLTRKHSNEHRQLAVTISSTERQLLEFVKSATGVGKITNKRVSRPHHSPSFTYAVYNRQALVLLEQVTPYLKTYKLDRANLILGNYLELTPRNGKYSPELLSRKSAFEDAVLGIKANALVEEPSPKGQLLKLLSSLEPLDEEFPDVDQDIPSLEMAEHKSQL
jgi:hypothetical protein